MQLTLEILPMTIQVSPDLGVKRCSACGDVAGRIVDDKGGKNTYFVIQGGILADMMTGRTTPLPHPVGMHAYACVKCNHIEFYAFEVEKPKSSSLQPQEGQ
jgi:hypothetical protein